jgi:hypothetical protein
MTVSVFIFIKGFMQRFNGKLNAVMFFDRNIDKLFEDISVIQVSGLFNAFAFNQVHRSHRSGNRTRAAEYLVSDIRDGIIIDFEKDFHGIPAGSQHLGDLIGIRQRSHVWLVNKISNGLLRVPATQKHLFLISCIILK